MQNQKNYILGLDIGISSVGWGMLELDENNNPFKIINTGVRIFTPGEVPKTGASKALERREKRGARRIIQRREYRLDRVRLLLSNYGFLAKAPEDIMPSEREEFLTKAYESMINNYYEGTSITPYDLKVKALHEKLSDEELGIILVHYAKHRGYKSNREDDSVSSGENGKIKKAIEENNKIISEKKYETVTEMFTKDEKFKDRIRNSDDDYKMSVTREMYEKEIEKVLESQIKFGLIDEEFKNKYLSIWKSQRHYSKGPGYYFYKEDGILKKKISPYGSETSLVARMTGVCKYDGMPRAPKSAPSAEMFVFLQNLLNLRYKTDESYTKLTKEEIKNIIELAKSKDKVLYKDIAKELGLENIIFQNNQLSKDTYKKCITELKEKFDLKEIKLTDLNDEQQKIYKDTIQKQKLNNVFGTLKTYNIFRKEFSKWNKEEWLKIKDNFKLLDEIATILTDCKLNEDIKRKVEESENIDNSYIEIIVNMPTLKDHIMLSLSAIYQVLPLMMEGKRTDEALKEIFGEVLDFKVEKKDLLPQINIKHELTNQRVMHSLSQSRKVINSIIKKYGMPKSIKIETARELAKSRDERNKIEKQQKENYEANEKVKEYLLEHFPNVFKGKEYISSTDLLKYKLWIEQDERCAYSRERITREQLFDKNEVQIDHILPYSRTYDDSYNNKTLVFTKYNQDKKNKTPYEWFGNTEKWNQYKNFINLLKINDKKKDNYLLENLSQDKESEMRNQNLNDTKYISKYLVNFIKAYLNVEKVESFSGSITGKLRGRWGLNGLTHSIESANYYIRRNGYEEIKKNRENHLHHAMDALVIASITKSLEQKITNYEKFARYINNKTSNQLQEFMEDNNFFIDGFEDENGEITQDSVKKYIEEGLKSGQLKPRKNNPQYLLSYPLPYEKFKEEAILRVYERDINVLKEKLEKEIGTYTKEEINHVHPIYPSFAKPKLSGALHKETISGYIKERNLLTNRIDVKKLKEKDLENIIDAKSGSKDVYETLKEWLMGFENGKEAYEANGYPINKKTGNLIKKIKLSEEYNNKGHFIKNGFVEKEDIYQIDIYKKENGNKLYFIGYDLFDLSQIKKGKDFDIILWYGQGNAKENMKFSELQSKYVHYLSLGRNQLINVEKNDGTEGIGYVVGFTSGLFEIKSILGDGKDLYGKNNLFVSERVRYQLTISTIKDIKKLDITMLGEIYGL